MRALMACGVAALLFGTAGFADDKKDEVDLKKLIGKWQPTEKKKDADLTLEFKKDGKLAITAAANGKDFTIDGTYKVTGNKIEVAINFGGQEQKETLTVIKLTDDELTTKDSKGKEETVKKYKEKK